jgi:hypothetical protein
MCFPRIGLPLVTARRPTPARAACQQRSQTGTGGQPNPLDEVTKNLDDPLLPCLSEHADDVALYFRSSCLTAACLQRLRGLRSWPTRLHPATDPSAHAARRLKATRLLLMF